VPNQSSYRSSMGRNAEVDLVRDELEPDGWLCGSRRHIPGPGDVLAVRTDRPPMLVEVKTTVRGPFRKFPPVDREELKRVAEEAGAQAWLAWRPYPSDPWRWIASGEWPEA
jgi:Holliday junction resolvase